MRSLFDVTFCHYCWYLPSSQILKIMFVCLSSLSVCLSLFASSFALLYYINSVLCVYFATQM